jgi:hypothetical protein
VKILFLALLSLSLAATESQATVVSQSFTAEATDDLESYPGDREFLTTLFNGDVTLGGPLDIASIDEGDWFDFRGSSLVDPSSGGRFGTIYGFGSVLLDFSGIGGILGFSGWATAAGVGADTLSFYDMSGALIDTVTDADGFGPGDGTMEFFSFVSSQLIGSISWEGPETAFDDLSYARNLSPVPVPAALPLMLLALGGLGLIARRRQV